MLIDLDISNLAIIERTSVRFEEGLNALTGETGAGKSILLDALGAVLGQRVSSSLVRTGATSARVEASFSIENERRDQVRDLLAEFGVDGDVDDLLVVSREIQASGRSSGRINGRIATIGQLNAIGALLVDIHGQSDHLSILKASAQRSMLDRYAGLDDERQHLAELVHQWRNDRQALREVVKGAREREQRIDLLRFQVGEIDEASLAPGEDDALSRERDVLQNADHLRQAALSAVEALAGDEAGLNDSNATALLRLADHSANELGAYDPEARSLGERMTELVVLAEDVVRDLRDYADSVEGDPERLADVDDRLALIQTLKRKYGASIQEILAYRAEISAELDDISGGRFDRDALEQAERSSRAKLLKAALALSTKRTSAAEALSAAIVQSIADLRMGNADVRIDVNQRPDTEGIELEGGRRVHVDGTGIDEVQFLIAPNAGEALKPLGSVASGGETARIMLAVKSILSDVDDTPTLVFDEIDVGVGGRSGQMVGEKLWSLTDRHQVIVISHLAQIAAFADKHYRIEKAESEGRVVSTVEELDPLTREEELAAMLDGVPATPESLANARAMLQRVYEFRAKRHS